MATADPNRLYRVLGVERTATAQEITTTFKKKAAFTHPDKFMGEECYAQKQAEFQELTEAHAELKDEELRKEYDRTGKTEQQRKDAGYVQVVRSSKKLRWEVTKEQMDTGGPIDVNEGGSGLRRQN